MVDVKRTTTVDLALVIITRFHINAYKTLNAPIYTCVCGHAKNRIYHTRVFFFLTYFMF